MNKTILAGLIASSLFAVFSAPAIAHEAGSLIVRAGAAMVAPEESSPSVAGEGSFKVSNDTQLGLTLGYMLTDNWGIELLAATPFSHDISLGKLGKIAETKHLPPTLVAQYYFGDSNSALRPYIGAGINYTNFFDNDFTNNLGGALTDLSLSTSFGFAAQLGLDYSVNDNWLINAAVWYVDISTDVKFNLAGQAQTVKTDIDPWVYMLSVGYQF